jgi:hypothetical protein
VLINPKKNLQSVLKNELIPIIIGLITALVLIQISFVGIKTDFEDASTFGTETTSIYSVYDGKKIHCSDYRDADQCITSLRELDSKNTVLLLGNSQIHAINQYQFGDQTVSALLFPWLLKKNLNLLAFSQPNANLQEQLVLFEYLSDHLPLKYLVLPIFFDDLREDGLRPGISDLISNQKIIESLSSTEIGKKIIKNNIIQKDSETLGIKNTYQEDVERLFDSWLVKNSELWNARPEMRGQVFTALYKARNFLLGINPNSKRKSIPGRYLDNFNALDAILDSAKEKNINVILFIPPIRQDLDSPYVDSEYKNFKVRVKAVSERYQLPFYNFENLVANEDWGSKNSTTVGGVAEVDFMHFKAKGHEKLALSLYKVITKQADEEKR